MADLAAEFQACKQAVIDSRKAWAEAEQTFIMSGSDDPTPVREAFEAMQFAKCCVIAAGEAFKGESFETVMARHESRSED